MHKLKLFAGSFLTALFVFPAFCPAQTISIVSGNGQLVCPDCAGGTFTFAPLTVQVNDAAGLPAANTTVTWTPNQAGLQSVPSTSTTNSSGQTSYNFQGLAFFPGLIFLPATVVAQIPAGSVTNVTFIETTALPINGGGPGVYANLISSSGAPSLSGAVGTKSATTITVTVYAGSGPVSGISLLLQAGATGPSVSCAPQAGQQTGAQPGMILTDSTGTATCTPVFGGAVGSGSYTINVGGKLQSWGPSNLTVTAGSPAIIKLITKSPETVNPGATVSLVAEVTDGAGNASQNAAVKWAETGAATLSNEVTSSLSNGYVTASVTPTSGTVTVTVTLVANGYKATFTINVNEVVTALAISSGNDQEALEGVAFAQPLVVQVNDNALPVPGATVNFAVTSSGPASGSAILSSPSAITNAEGLAQIAVTAGASYGPVAITASVAYAGTTFKQIFSLTVNPPGPIITAVVNAAGFGNSPAVASPCSLVTIYGKGLATGLQGVVQPFILPQMQVAGISVQFGGASAPILYVANESGQEYLSAQVPCGVTPNAAVQVVVTASGAASSPFPVPVTAYSPGIFEFMDTDGALRAVLVRQDGSFITLANPAQPGDIVRMYVTGLGQTNPPLTTDEFDPLVLVDNDWVPQDLTVSASLLVGVNNGGALVVSQKYAYGMVGVYEVAFQVPENTALSKNVPFAIVVTQDPAQLYWGNASLIPIQ